MTVTRIPVTPTAQCRSCDGDGEVLSVRGERRPCSRCRPDEFAAWYRRKVEDEGKTP